MDGTCPFGVLREGDRTQLGSGDHTLMRKTHCSLRLSRLGPPTYHPTTRFLSSCQELQNGNRSICERHPPLPPPPHFPKTLHQLPPTNTCMQGVGGGWVCWVPEVPGWLHHKGREQSRAARPRALGGPRVKFCIVPFRNPVLKDPQGPSFPDPSSESQPYLP